MFRRMSVHCASLSMRDEQPFLCYWFTGVPTFISQIRLEVNNYIIVVLFTIHLISPQNGWTPLIRASNEGNLKLVKVIADLGAHLNDQTAVRFNNSCCCANINPTLQHIMQEGWSSVMVSSNYGHNELVKELADRGADLNLATVRWNKFVCQTCADVVEIPWQTAGDTALHIATLRNRPEVVKELARLGANLNIGNKVKVIWWCTSQLAGANEHQEWH